MKNDAKNDHDQWCEQKERHIADDPGDFHSLVLALGSELPWFPQLMRLQHASP